MMLHFGFSVVVACLGMVMLPVVAQAQLSPAFAEAALAATDVAVPSPQARQAEGLRLQAKRAALEQAFQQDMAICYQQFDVTRCRNVARDKRIEANAALRKEELRYNARERRMAAEEAQLRVEDKQREAQRKAQEAAASEVSVPAQGNRPSDVAAQQRSDNLQRAAYEQKQREAADRRSSLEKRLRERDKPPAAPLPIPEAAK